MPHEPDKMAQRYGQAVARDAPCPRGFQQPTIRASRAISTYLDHRDPYGPSSRSWRIVRMIGPTCNGSRERCASDSWPFLRSDLEQGFFHGDLQGYHANVAPDGTLTFYDLDCGAYGYRAYDLAVFLWCCRLEDAVAARWPLYLQGYRETRAIRDLDMQAVPLLVCARYLWHMGVHTQNAPDWGVEFLNDEYWATHLKRLREAEADYMA